MPFGIEGEGGGRRNAGGRRRRRRKRREGGGGGGGGRREGVRLLLGGLSVGCVSRQQGAVAPAIPVCRGDAASERSENKMASLLLACTRTAGQTEEVDRPTATAPWSVVLRSSASRTVFLCPEEEGMKDEGRHWRIRGSWVLSRPPVILPCNWTRLWRLDCG